MAKKQETSITLQTDSQTVRKFKEMLETVRAEAWSDGKAFGWQKGNEHGHKKGLVAGRRSGHVSGAWLILQHLTEQQRKDIIAEVANDLPPGMAASIRESERDIAEGRVHDHEDVAREPGCRSGAEYRKPDPPVHGFGPIG